MSIGNRNIRWLMALSLAMVLAGGYFLVLAPPANFPSGDIVVISRGSTVSDIANQLDNAGVIKHAMILRLILRGTTAGDRVQAGPYLFEKPQNALTIAYRLAKGVHGLPPVKVTLPEGLSVREMASRIEEAFPLLSAEDFFSAGKPQEGYLFPDTYLFPPDATIESIVKAMRENFDAKIKTLEDNMGASGLSLSDTVILASLIEKEARTTENRRLVSGVLHNRLARSMPLQVDAVFGYIFNRDTYSPSYEDLKVNSPYNTYTHTGLPPGPINNPGLDSLQAAVLPTKTDYLYYLTDREGVMHYAKTYAAHLANEQKYLK